MLSACGFWLVGLGFYFMLFRPPFLPEDLRFIGRTLDQIQLAAPGLAAWVERIFIVMGGFMTAAGVLVLFVASVAMPARSSGTSWALGIAGLLTVALMSIVNFSLHSDYRWVLLLPASLWSAGFLFYLAER